MAVETSNRNRTLQSLRTTLKRHGGAQSSTAFLFSRRGRVIFAAKPGIGVDEVLEAAIEAGAEDVVESEATSLDNSGDPETEGDGSAGGGEYGSGSSGGRGDLLLWTPPSGTARAAKEVGERFGLRVAGSDIVWAPNADTLAAVDRDEEAALLRDALAALREIGDVRAVYANAVRGAAVSDELWAAVEEYLES